MKTTYSLPMKDNKHALEGIAYLRELFKKYFKVLRSLYQEHRIVSNSTVNDLEFETEEILDLLEFKIQREIQRQIQGIRDESF